MTIYLAVDSSLSMRSPPEDGRDKTCWQLAGDLCAKIVERLIAANIIEVIKLVDFSHNSSVLLHKTQSPKEVEKALSGVTVSASSDMLSLFSLMKMEKANEQCTLIVITDGRSFTPEEMKYSHIPECRVIFVSVLDEVYTDENQITRFVVISALSVGVDVSSSADAAALFMPLFISEFADLATFSVAVTAQICPPSDFTLRCGLLSSPIELLPMKCDKQWDNDIEIIGFIKANRLPNTPLENHYFISERSQSDPNETESEASSSSNGFIVTLIDALVSEEMYAICHLNEHTYGVIRSIRKQGSDDRLLVIASFPQGFSSIYWLPHLDRLTPQAFTDGTSNSDGGGQLCATNDQLAKPTYAKSPLTCWLDQPGIQADFQKVVRFLRKIPDRTAALYAEVNRMHHHACAIGAENIILKLAELIEQESQQYSPIVRKHGEYISDALRKRGVKNSSEIPVLQ